MRKKSLDAVTKKQVAAQTNREIKFSKKLASLISAGLLTLSLFAVALPSPATAAHQADGLIGYWNLDSDATEPAHGLNGTLNGDTAFVGSTIVPGDTGHATFDGDGDYIEVANDSELDLDEAISISFWFQLSGASGDNAFPRPVTKGQTTTSDGAYGVFVHDTSNPTDIGLRFIDQSNVTHDVRDTGLTNYNDGLWHHVVATYSNADDEGKLYFDGSLETTVAIGGDTKIRVTGDDLTIGAGRGDAQRDFNGGVNEVRIYNRALSQDEVTALRNYTFTVDLTPSEAENLLGTDHEVTATLDPALGFIPVLFEVGGANFDGGLPYVYTDDNGQAVFSYTGNNLGDDLILACIDLSDLEDGGLCDVPFDEPSDFATKSWFIDEITLTPESAFNPTGTEHTVMADIGVDVEGVDVLFVVSGANNTSGVEATDSDGVASFTYLGVNPGTDTITACWDADGEGDCDAEEVQDSATKIWLEHFVTGGGKIGAKKALWTFAGNAGYTVEGELMGQFQIVDHSSKRVCHFSEFHSLVFSGDTTESPDSDLDVATFEASGTCNDGSEVEATVAIHDEAEPGKNADTISVDSVDDTLEVEEQTIDGGNFQVHPPEIPEL